jgi:hypothetical protein
MAPKNVFRPGRSEKKGGKALTKEEKTFQKKYSPPSKSKDKNDDNKILKDLDEAQKQKDNTEKAKDQASLNVGAGTGSGMQTTDFLEDLKDAYKTGLFSSGTKGKAFMDKYNLKPGQLAQLRSAIDMGLGTRIGKGGNVLTDIIGDLRQEGILRTSGPGAEFLQLRADEVFEPGMKKSDRFLPFEDPQGFSENIANFASQYNPFIAITDGIFGSTAGRRATYFGREKGLEGEELNNFAAAVANDRNLYNQMMSTPLMQDYEIDEFRAETVKQARDNRDGRGDPNPISGTQPGEDDDDNDTDPGTGTFTPTPQNFYTFFDPNLGRYRSGTYDEYLQYVTAKDGGIIQLQQGGTLPNAPGGVASQEVKKELDELFADRKEIQDLVTPTKSEQEGSRMIMSEIDDRAKAMADMEKEGIMNRLQNQSRSEIFRANNPDMGPALRKDLGFFGKLGDSGLSLVMEAIRKGDITEGSANQYLEEALNNFVAAGIIPPNTSYDQLTDPFKDLVTREAAMIARSENMRQEMSMFRDPKGKKGLELEEPIYKMQEGKPEDFEQIDPVMRDFDTRQMNRTFDRSGDMYEVADGGIIGLKQGGMNDMMQANELMFKDPSDKEEWEYNV